ncbi:hypothetical protein HYY75_13250 [bacterium]|nr:hypothetical protein [bacterium]
MRRNVSGVALVVLVMVVLTICIGFSVALPRATNAVKETKETELRFVLGEFRRSIEKFVDRNGCNPKSLDELLKDNEGRRFLRRIYADPFTKKNQWAFEITTEGIIIHSLSSETSLSGVSYSEFR